MKCTTVEDNRYWFLYYLREFGIFVPRWKAIILLFTLK